MMKSPYPRSRGRVTKVGACITVLALGGLGLVDTSVASAAPVTDVTIGVNAAVAGEIQPFLAEDSGIFTKLGIHASVSVIPSSELVEDLAAGKVQFGAFGAPQPEEAAMAGAPVKWLAVWENTPNTVLIGAPGVTTIAGLKGKTMGITTPGSLIDIFSRLSLGRVGVSPSAVNFQALQSTTSIEAAFVGGSIQAAILSPPESTTALKDKPGSTTLLNIGKYYKWPQGGLVGYMPWVTSHSAAAAAVVKGIAEATKEYRTDPAAAKAAIKAVDPTVTTASLNVSYSSALSTLQTTTIAPSLQTEKFVLSTLSSLYPGKYPKATAANAPTFIDSTYATAAMKSVGSLG